MANLTAVQFTETCMEKMKFCTDVMEKELKKFNLDFTVYQSYVAALPGVLDVNFDIAYNRCAFMYKYTLCNIYFFKDCMKKFIAECTEFETLISKWAADPNVRLCSLSCGPGLDYLSFMLALSDHSSPPSFKNVTVLSKHGAWRNTISIVADSLEEGALSGNGIGELLNFKNIEVVQTNLLISIPAKGFETLRHSTVILMVKTINLSAPGSNEAENIKTKLLELVSSLKPEATIFCIDTKPSLALFLEILPKFHGKFLCEPDHFSSRVPITFSDDYKEKHGCFPVVCARGAFFVWQKLSSFEPDPNFNISPLNSLAHVTEISHSSSEKAFTDNEEILNVTKTLKDLILPNSLDLGSISVGNVISNSLINDNIGGSESATLSLVNTPSRKETNKSSPIQTLLSSQSFQETNSHINFNEKNCSSPSLKKSSSIDNSFFQSSSKSKLFHEESDLQQNFPLLSWTNEESCFTSSTQLITTKKKMNEKIENSINGPKSNQAAKSTLESKATQTEFHQTIPKSSLAKDLTERIKRLVSSLENEAQKNATGGQTNYPLQEFPSRSTNYSPCSTTNSDMDIKPTCNGFQTEGEITIGCCNYVQMNHAHCCSPRHNMIHRCGMHCCRSCVHSCHIKPCRSTCENNIASRGLNLAQPQIVIPLQNVSNDVLMQIISAAKSGSKPQ